MICSSLFIMMLFWCVCCIHRCILTFGGVSNVQSQISVLVVVELSVFWGLLFSLQYCIHGSVASYHNHG